MRAWRPFSSYSAAGTGSGVDIRFVRNSGPCCGCLYNRGPIIWVLRMVPSFLEAPNRNRALGICKSLVVQAVSMNRSKSKEVRQRLNACQCYDSKFLIKPDYQIPQIHLKTILASILAYIAQVRFQASGNRTQLPTRTNSELSTFAKKQSPTMFLRRRRSLAALFGPKRLKLLKLRLALGWWGPMAKLDLKRDPCCLSFEALEPEGPRPKTHIMKPFPSEPCCSPLSLLCTQGLKRWQGKGRLFSHLETSLDTW